MPAASETPAELLAPLRAEPAATAVLTDVDGTLAPIVGDPAEAHVLPEARDALTSLAQVVALVACVSGRPAIEARKLVGVDTISYVGNHGLERLRPGSMELHESPALEGHERDAAAFAEGIDRERLSTAGLRLEDKGPIRALHWRGAGDEDAAERAAEALAAEAERAGLAVHRGRKVLELRPRIAFDKGLAIAGLLADHPVRHALYAGDDRTDLDGFERLRELASDGALETAVCIGIASAESPYDVSAKADLVLPDPPAFAKLLAGLAHDVTPGA